MFTITRFSGAIASIALVSGVLALCAPARADVDLYVAPEQLFTKAPLADCSTKAKAALSALLQPPFEAGAGTGQWLAKGANDANGDSHASAVIHCFPIGGGYVMSLTCAVEPQPGKPSAADICTAISKTFGTP